MVPILVLITTLVVFSLLGRFGVKVFGGVRALRSALAAMFLVTAGAHFVEPLRSDLVRIVPPSLPAPEFLVTFTGLAELAGAIGLLIPRLAPLAASGLLVLLVAVLPANVYQAQAGLTVDGSHSPLALRLVEQMVFIVAVAFAGFDAKIRTTFRRMVARPETP
jgi:uncharacterized membrane protein